MLKKYFPIDEISKMTGFSKSSIYKKTAARLVSFYRPFGKRIFMTQEQIDAMMTQTRIKSREELEAEIKGGCDDRK